MIDLGYTKAEMREIEDLLNGPHRIKVSIMILDLEHAHITNVSDRLLAGQVDFDLTADVTRTLKLDLSDPDATLSINPESPEDGALFVNRMIKVVYSVAPPLPIKWYDIPLFVGPITALSRDTHTLSLDCKGKDILTQSNAWNGRVYREGHKVTQVIRSILRDIVGENRLSIPEKDRTIDKDIVVGVDQIPLQLIKKYARSVQHQFWYNGRGVAVLRRPLKRVLHTFSGRNIVSDVKFKFDPTTIINSVVVRGGKGEGQKQKASARVAAPPSHPFSPQKLGRNGAPRYLTKIIEDSSLTTDTACRQRAREELEAMLLMSMEAEFTALPNPLMEEYDVCRLESDEYSFNFRPTKWSIGLTHDATMTIGTNKKVSFLNRKKGRKTDRRNKGSRPRIRPYRPGKWGDGNKQNGYWLR